MQYKNDVFDQSPGVAPFDGYSHVVVEGASVLKRTFVLGVEKIDSIHRDQIPMMPDEYGGIGCVNGLAFIPPTGLHGSTQ